MAEDKVVDKGLLEYYKKTEMIDGEVEARRKQFLKDNPSLFKFLKAHEMQVEYDEVQMDTFDFELYPEPLKKYRLIMVEHEEHLEAMYYWFLTSYQQDWGYNRFDKVMDVYASSEQSALFGVSQQRLALQQDKVSQFLQAIGKMVKEIFQFVRELRIIDERLDIYRDTYSKNYKKAESADITLKGIWIDMVQGGAKNPASVYGLASDVGFAILPDLFFSVRPRASVHLEKDTHKITDADLNKLFAGEVNNLDDTVDKLEVNRKNREVLKRKLREFLTWKKMTFKELLTRRKFTLQYFRQHYDIIKLYMGWVKPYLRNIRRLSPDQDRMDSATLVGAFERSIVEVEFLASKNKIDYGRWYACGIVNFLYVTSPQMSYQQEGFQRGPKHSGKLVITLRSYVWTKEQIEDYIKMRKEEDLDLITTIDASLKEAMVALGDDMKAYLAEAGEKIFMEEAEAKKKEKQKKPKMSGAAEPFVSVFKGFGEIIGAFTGGGSLFGEKKEKINVIKDKKQYSSAKGDAKNALWRGFKNYRKAHKLVTW